MLSGQRPFAAPTAQASLARKILEPPTPIRAVAPDISEPVERVVEKAMATLPMDRYASAAQLADAFEAAATGGRTSTTRRHPRRTTWWIGAAALILAGAVAVLWRPRWIGATDVRSLAVLPFTTPGADSAQRYFAEGMHDEVIGELNKIGALRVISRTSVMKYHNAAMTIPQIARELGVDAVVEGAIYRNADSAKLHLSLVRAVPEERQLWSHTYQVPVSNLQALNGDVTRGIVD